MHRLQTVWYREEAFPVPFDSALAVHSKITVHNRSNSNTQTPRIKNQTSTNQDIMGRLNGRLIDILLPFTDNSNVK